MQSNDKRTEEKDIIEDVPSFSKVEDVTEST